MWILEWKQILTLWTLFPQLHVGMLPTLGSKVLARLAGGRQSRVSLQSKLDILLGFCSLPQTRCQVGIGWGQELLWKSKQQREEAPGGDTGLS